jgi:hypothetical protein
MQKVMAGLIGLAVPVAVTGVAPKLVSHGTKVTFQNENLLPF